MDKRERLERTVLGEPVDRPPVSLWRHFPGDDQRALDLARSTVDFQATYDWDFVKVTPANTYAVADYPVLDDWEDTADGRRICKKTVIQRSLDWTALRLLEPMRGSLGRQLECLELIVNQIGEQTPVIATVYSPLIQAEMLAGTDLLIQHLRLESDRLHSGLNTLTENMLRYLDILKRLSIAGIYYVIEHASYSILSEDEYHLFGLPYDQKLFEAASSKWWLNIIQLRGSLPMFKYASQINAQAVHWQDQDTEPKLPMGKTLVNGAVCGGLSTYAHLQRGSPTTIRDTVREVMQTMNNRRLMLCASDPLLVTTPLSNIRAVRQAVEVG
jgi:uroporphyrinogen decarboxylase